MQLLSYSPCDTPLPYKLGQLDSRFGLRRSQVLTDITTATGLWSSAYGKQLFVQSSNAVLTVNFIYDSRQALDTQINTLNSKLTQNNTTLSSQIASYKAEEAAFEQKLAAFQETVAKYNAEGGAPEDVYNQLVSEQQDLESQQNVLQKEAQTLNLSTQNYNNGVSALNSDISQFNSALSKKPEEGLYDGANNTITIYFANNHDELLHTLTHEFGHSLNMQHVPDPQAIMYPYTTTSLRITPDDLAELKKVCQSEPVFLHWILVVDSWFATLHPQIAL